MVVHINLEQYGNNLFSSFWDSFEVGNTILSLMIMAVASIRKEANCPSFRFQYCPDWICLNLTTFELY